MKTLSLIGLTAMLLTACGGGGSDGAPSTKATASAKPSANAKPNTSANTNQPNATTTAQPSTNAKPNTSASTNQPNATAPAQPSANVKPNTSASTNQANATATAQPSINAKPKEVEKLLIKVDNKVFNLSIAPKGWIGGDTNNGQFKGMNNQSSFYGVWEANKTDHLDLMYTGIKATDIPQSGRAVYRGNVVRYDTIKKEVIDAGKSEINVNFGSRTVDGKLTMDSGRRDITLHPTHLNGSKYAGDASAPSKLVHATSKVGETIGKIPVLGSVLKFIPGVGTALNASQNLSKGAQVLGVGDKVHGRYEGELFGEKATETAGKVEFEGKSELDAVFGGVREIGK